jgi:hypothetical protein
MSIKLIGGSLGTAVCSSGALFVFVQTGVPTTWVLGTLVTILIAVLTAFGLVLKKAYDTAKKWEAILEGRADAEDGFIKESKDRHTDLKESQKQVHDQLELQAELLSELSYLFAELAEEIDDRASVNVNINLDRLNELHERQRDAVYGQDSSATSTSTDDS